jgi:hypothetical protein
MAAACFGKRKFAALDWFTIEKSRASPPLNRHGLHQKK